VIGRREKVRFKAGLESDKRVRWANVRREWIPIIRRRYTKNRLKVSSTLAWTILCLQISSLEL